jgi:Xaa-Pro aminopeptidase
VRLRHLEKICEQQSLDALVVSTPVNVRYLTGFTGTTALFVASSRGHRFITDGRYDALVREWMREGRFARLEIDRVDLRYDLTLAACLERLGVRRVGFEAGHVTVATLRRWQEAASAVEWRPTDGVVEGQRLIKDVMELEVFRRAAKSLSRVASAARTWLAIDRSEQEVARDVDRALEREGFERPAFDTIVASGPNSAYPHARATDRRLRAGDLVLLDFGGVLDGYCVDLTRMASMGPVESAAGRLFAAVQAAQDAAIRAIRAGVAGSDVDRAARSTLESHGLGAAFLHGTGHGLGLEVHEAPRLARAESGATDVLEAGMVCTVEPGAYVEGLGGVRLEDDVLVTPAGVEVLTDAPRDLVVV